ncbi:MauE/DoxX family redox-associated membrane protein [Dactylosporangium matsuzakiense]|uniref:Methylamine utilization protein MauE n=1 Tax=Dactylosporangium matsuzakiense TaxID=53360 RepID=A0A9W6KK04_9ACTN|nr:MauE/DoxX family redox-associated membrane protein [Dactylosporangium matsuzakiense]GLL02250.1 methylamine utilization protein MauE [Dactylosporangium matsuzakiense]
MGYVEVGARLLLATVFAVALFGKVTGARAYAAFVDSLRQMRVLPAKAARPAAAASIATEAAVVVLLVLPWRWAAAAGFVLAAGLLAVFAAAIAMSLRGGNRAPCRCFGASATPLGKGHIVRNSVLIAIALAGLGAAAGAGAIAVPGAVVAGAAGLVVGIVVTAYDDIAALFR